MLSQRLQHELRYVARRYRRLFAWSACAMVWLATAGIGTGLLELAHAWGQAPQWWIVVLIVAAFLATVTACLWGMRRTRDNRWVARRIEAKHPDLNCLLLTAVEQTPTAEGGKLGFLQQRVVRDALLHAHRTDWRRDVPTRRLLGGQFVAIVSLALMLVVFDRLAARTVPDGDADGRDPAVTGKESLPYQVTVSPGDTEIERGTSLVVTARFASQPPDEAVLVVTNAAGETEGLPMSLSLSDPVFGARIADVQADLNYRVEYESQSTRDYRAVVYEHPQLIRADIHLEYPSYTGLPPKRVEDTRRATAVEGTRASLQCALNKPVRGARLVSESGEEIALAASAADPRVYEVTLEMRESTRYRLVLEDDDGRANKEPPQITLNVTPNRRPDVKLAEPARDVRVSPIEELRTRTSFWDDYGLRAFGVQYTLPGREPQEIFLGQSTERNQRKQIEHLIAFEDLQAEPDQLLAYYFWAEDIGPDGEPRRTLGDMYFAEVRHFEEIFREAESPPGGQSPQQQQQSSQQSSQNAEQAEQLAELQKQIINATWTVIRRENKVEPSDEFAGDLDELQAAQADALQKLDELQENLQDGESLQHAADVERQMLTAMSRLTASADTESPQLLTDAMAAEQAAYQALLKLRAREFNVTRSQQQSPQQSSAGSASGPQSRAQQQLEQLELDSSENRYETERQASQQQAREQEQRENLQVLNRLRELARRQEDVNRRMKELQSALEQAEDEAERERIREQLKRLREQEQQMLRDMDELAERMDRPENQERMSEARQQLEQTREDIRQTTESLREGQISQAVASGARAEEQLDSMREEFRQSASGRFQEQARQLRDAAEELDQNERALAERLRQDDAAQETRPTLRRADNREELEQSFREQREALNRLLESMQETVEEAEEAEPLMAGQLYDAIRNARQQRVDDALDATAQLLDRGLVDQAKAAESQASEGIERLRADVQRAAENVLTSEEEALRRAQHTLEDLARQLDEEMRRVTGQPAEAAADPEGRQPSPPEAGTERPSDEPAADDIPQPGGQAKSSSAAGKPGQSEGQPSQKRSPGSPSGKPSPGKPGAQGQPGASGKPGAKGQPGAAGQPSSQDPSGRPQGQPSPKSSGQPSPQTSQAGGAKPAAGNRPSGRGGPQTATGPTGIERLRGPSGPITGDFLPWSDQLRDVEEMLDDPDLRSDVARVREAARDIRRQMHRDFQGPNWDLVRDIVAEPLNEVRDRVADELRRRQSDEALVPIDRDPVPQRFADPVRRYYERLGSGE